MHRSRSESAIRGVSFSRSGSNSRVQVVEQSPVKPPTPPSAEESALAEDVKRRLEILRREQYAKDIEAKFVEDQKILADMLLESQVQCVISRKIKEAAEFEESRSLQSRCSCESSVITKIGKRAHTACTSSMSSHSSALQGAQTYPSSSRIKFAGDINCPEQHQDQDDLSEMHSVGSASMGSISRRPLLIVIKKTDIDKSVIQRKVQDRLPSPEKVYAQQFFPTPSCTASLFAQRALRSQQAQNAKVALVEQNSQLHQQPQPLLLYQINNSVLTSAKVDTTPQKLLSVTEHDSEKSSKDGSSSKKSMSMSFSGENSGTQGRFRSIATRVSQSSRAGSFRNSVDDFDDEKDDFISNEESSFNGNGSSRRGMNDIDAHDSRASSGKPAPFLKAKSSSGIMNSALSILTATSTSYDVNKPVNASSSSVISGSRSSAVPVMRGLSVSRLRKSVSRQSRGGGLRSSQIFTQRGSIMDMHIDELQGEEILSTRFRGWTPPPMSDSSKHDSSTNFY